MCRSLCAIEFLEEKARYKPSPKMFLDKNSKSRIGDFFFCFSSYNKHQLWSGVVDRVSSISRILIMFLPGKTRNFKCPHFNALIFFSINN